MQRARGAAQPPATASEETSKDAALQSGAPPHDWHHSRQAGSQFTSQREYGIEFHGFADRRRATRKGHDHRDRKNHWKEHGRDRDLRIEDRTPNLAGQKSTSAEAYDSSKQGEQSGFREEHRRDCEFSRAQRL